MVSEATAAAVRRISSFIKMPDPDKRPLARRSALAAKFVRILLKTPSYAAPVPLAWTAEQLHMASPSNVAQACRRPLI